ncbi:MAG: putative toxin-antitoxin system toxin component, PIN family [Planctomycetes bacterium]|jgi:putative PIN family toxin of toxin-antitoxin system|nr:putative toxin-antitoxin system toxin component, PIN family [Planctomycetota bacterium]
MRIVLDTNVLMSGIFFGGPPYAILQAWRDGEVQFAVCLEILAECRGVALRLSQKYKGLDISSVLDLVAVQSRIVQATPMPMPVCDDPKDDIFLACALAARTRILVSGDRHLLAVSGWAGIQVLRPKAFVDRFL